MHKGIVVLALALTLGGCATAPQSQLPGGGGVVDEKAQRQQSRVGQRVEDRVDQETDAAVDSVLDRLLDKVFGN